MTLRIPSWYRLLTILALFLCATAALPVSAAGAFPMNDEPSTTVKMGDLDLNTDSGRRALLDRLSKAANRVCRDAPVAMDRDLGNDFLLAPSRRAQQDEQKAHKKPSRFTNLYD